MQNQVNYQYLPQGVYNQYQQPNSQNSGSFQNTNSNYMTQPEYYMPQQYYYPTQTYPSSGVGAVNIQIYNPTANPQGQGFYQPVSCAPYPCNYNNMMTQSGGQIQPSQYNNGQIAPDMNQNLNLNNNQNGVAAQAQGEDTTKTEEKKEENKQKVALTDDYIKTLENYLNSQDKKIRLMGAKELFDRFKEDETRKDDAALTALLNKTLQDPAETVKFVALTALDAGYATGNDETAQILQQMQSSTSSYGEDAALASQILLKMSGYQANAEAAALNSEANLNETAASLNQNQTMPQPALQETQNSMNAVDSKLPPTDTDTLLQQNGTKTNQSMMTPVNNTAEVA